MDQRFVEIPIDPKDEIRFKKWLEFYGMSAKRMNKFTYRVTDFNPIDLYWLGSNMAAGDHLRTPLSRPRF